MTLLECLIGIALCALLLNPLLKTSADLVVKQIEYEKIQSLIAEVDRAMELIGRAIRIAGYRNIQTSGLLNLDLRSKIISSYHPMEIKKRVGYKQSDAITIKHELSDGVNYDCIGNAITKECAKNHLVLQGFFGKPSSGHPKRTKSKWRLTNMPVS